MRIKSTRILRHFEQVKCPNSGCGKVILSPEVSFNRDDDRVKERYGQCIWCGRSVVFKIGREIPITAELGPTPINMDFGITLRTSPGVAIVTQLVVVYWPSREEYEARVGIAIMGNTNFESSINANPFDPNFHDNIVRGIGPSIDAAIENLRKDLDSMVDTLFHR